LAKWVFTTLKKTFIKKNITSGFCNTGIFPSNSRAMDEKMGPSEFYRSKPAIARDILANPITMDLVVPIAVDLAAAENVHSMPGMFVLELKFSSGQGGQSCKRMEQ
jgi:hypothetical protein